MATKTADPEVTNSQTPEDEWEDVKIGLGKEWDLEQEGPITGILVGMETLDVEDRQNGGLRATNAYVIDTGDPVQPNRFFWGSYNLDLAMAEIPAGTKVRVTFTGRDTFTGDKGPQTVKTYRVQKAKAA